jgi:hypothetical protein
MSARSTFLQLAAKAGLLFGALFVVSVLLAAMPGHRAPIVQSAGPQESSSPSQSVDHSNLPGMDMSDTRQRTARRSRHGAQSSPK